MRTILAAAAVLGLAGAASSAFSQDANSSAALQARLTTAIDEYSSCLLKSADTLLPDASKSPETIADESHTACGSTFAAASDAALVYTASTVPKSGKLQAVIISMEEMTKYKTKLRAITIQHVIQKRAGSSENAQPPAG
jgi:hypothetical protein